MPNTAKILPFRSAPIATSCTREQAVERAKEFVRQPHSQRSADFLEAALSDGDVLTSVCSLLWEAANSTPAEVSQDAAQIYGWLQGRQDSSFFFDERDYFLGESALLAAAALRILGKRDETERWLDRAEASFRHTVSPAPHLGRASYTRLTLRFDMRRYDEVLELVPSVALTFQKLGMERDLAKCYFLEAMALKDLDRQEEAIQKLERLASAAETRHDEGLRGMVLLNLGDLQSGAGNLEVALASFAAALPMLQTAQRRVALADLKGMVAETLRRAGRTEAALEAYREAVRCYQEVGASTRAAFLRVILAEALLEAGRPREAEWEIVAALPTIDREGMAPEGLAAMALLRESVRQKRADPRALVQLRESLKAKN